MLHQAYLHCWTHKILTISSFVFILKDINEQRGLSHSVIHANERFPRFHCPKREIFIFSHDL